MATVQIPEIIGLPPESYESEALIYNTMPIAEFTPCNPDFSFGPVLYQITPDWKNYESLLNSYGFFNKRPIKIAFIADSMPSYTFTNEYGESFIDRMTDFVTSTASDISQMFGGKTVGESVSNIANKLKGSKNDVIKGLGGTIGDGLDNLRGLQNQIASSGKTGAFLSKTIDMISSLGAGSRMDFPLIWKSSNFTPSISMTTRLYNPLPKNIEMTNKYIIGPLAAILTMACPTSSGPYTFQWPFFSKIKCKGLFNFEHGFISSISLIIGGDQSQVTYTQIPSLIDVRIEIGTVYNTVIASPKGTKGALSLNSLLESIGLNFKELKDINIIETEMIQNQLIMRDEVTNKDNTTPTLLLKNKTTSTLLNKNRQSVSKGQTPSDPTTPAPQRVPSNLKNKVDGLIWV